MALGIFFDPMAVPPTINSIYQKLQNEVVWIHGHWLTYQALFGESEKRVDLLNQCASAAFYVIQRSLLQEVELSITRITDSPIQGRNQNLSLRRLLELIDPTAYPDLHAEMSGLLTKIDEGTTTLRIKRNKAQAHLDLRTAMEAETSLRGSSREEIEEILLLIRRFMNCVELRFNDSEYGYEHFHMLGDGHSLVDYLKRGARLYELERDGTVSWDDTHGGEWEDA